MRRISTRERPVNSPTGVSPLQRDELQRVCCLLGPNSGQVRHRPKESDQPAYGETLARVSSERTSRDCPASRRCGATPSHAMMSCRIGRPTCIFQLRLPRKICLCFAFPSSASARGVWNKDEVRCHTRASLSRDSNSRERVPEKAPETDGAGR